MCMKDEKIQVKKYKPQHLVAIEKCHEIVELFFLSFTTII